MKFSDAKNLIYNKPKGFRVSFERQENGMLHGDYFPDRSEYAFETEEEAWDWAERFSRVPHMVNIYVVELDFSPVKNYREKMFKRHAL